MDRKQTERRNEFGDLALGRHDADYVGADYGPAGIKADADAARLSVEDGRRSYVINDHYKKDLVRRFIESRGGTAEHPETHWKEFERLLSSPRLPSGLR